MVYVTNRLRRQATQAIHCSLLKPDPLEDLINIRDYIEFILVNPDVTTFYVDFFYKKIDSLQYNPSRIAPVDEEPWHSRGIRKLIANNFYIYYRDIKEKSAVYILNIVYAKREQLKALEKLKSDKY